ncbi:MAG: PilZ domain-containing protein, partial [SAR324 cluster bacterium]|nr:PilZ domain-containing protein [SAR324 cluster bacterium]
TDQPVHLDINLGAPDAVISMDCEIAYLTADRVGLRCVTIDLDSIAHLRRLIELNSGDPKQVERELSLLV